MQSEPQDAPNVATGPETYDAIVVGSGITGGWAAKELCEKGLDVLLLERGRYVEHGDYPTEHMPSSDFAYRGFGDKKLYDEEYSIQSRCYAFGEATRHFFVNDEKHAYDQEKPFSWIRGYHLGGRSIMWGRQCYRWSDFDFQANARGEYGTDWPIRYRDVASWYDYVEQHVGISGQEEGLEQLPDSQFLPPMEMNCVEGEAKQRIEAAFPSRTMTIGRTAVLTEQHKGRAPCHYCGPCHRGCSTGSYFSSLSSTLPAAEATGNLTIACDSVVRKVLLGPEEQRATGVSVVDRETKQERTYHGRLVFLCASTLGTTQLMLNSTSRRFPNGIANSSGVLGHYLMDHVFQTGATGDVPGHEDKFFYGNRPNGIYIPRYQNLERPDADGEDFLRGFAFQGRARRRGWGRGTSEPGFGASLKRRLRRPGSWLMRLHGYGEMLPRYENHVALSDTATDEWGLPTLEISCEYGENADRLRERIQTDAAEMLEAAGAQNVEPFQNDVAPGLCIHEMGTARMGRDPATSVLNAHNQAHDVPNLFVTDGSCMASSACQNPSLTYMALTARAADYAVQQLKRRAL